MVSLEEIKKGLETVKAMGTGSSITFSHEEAAVLLSALTAVPVTGEAAGGQFVKCFTLWRSIDTAPEDQPVILCTSGGHVGEASMLIDEDTGQQKWAWASCPLHPNHIPYGWQALPDGLNAPASSEEQPNLKTKT